MCCRVYPKGSEDWPELNKLNAEQWQIDCLRLNPEYVFWGNFEDYRASHKNGWDASFTKGLITTEDLWDLSSKDLDTIYRGISKELKSLQEDSLLEKKGSASSTLELQVAIIKRVYEAKRAEAAEREKLAVKRDQVRQLNDIIAQKENTALSEKSLEDLKKMRDDLEAEGA